MDKICIKGLEVTSLIGVYDWERKAKQTLYVDLQLVLNLHDAALSDNVDDTVNYAEAANLLAEIADKSHFELLEALALKMISGLFEQYSLSQVTIKLIKPGILPNAREVSVELTRESKN